MITICEQFLPLPVNFLVLSGATTFTSSDFLLEAIIINKRKFKPFLRFQKTLEILFSVTPNRNSIIILHFRALFTAILL